MARGVFVTGTDTGVGKTVVSAALVMRYRREVPLTYWKPIQTGIEQDNDTEEIRRLAACGVGEIWDHGVRLEHPVSPHLAARMSGQRIDAVRVSRAIDEADEAARWVVEGAGGVLVPINESALMVDLMILLAMPVLVVARSTLGTINHTLLTLEALRSRSLRIAGIVMVGPHNADNREAIELYGRTRVLAELPIIESLTPAALADWARVHMDPQGQLARSWR
jgi:dethiobiotin synthase